MLSQEDDIETKIKNLISKMTLQEKIGQLQQLSYSEQTLDSDTTNQLINGQIGSFLNLFDVNVANEAQRIIMTQSRLKIPLLLGLDVIHGFRTMFPIPLGQAATFNTDLVEQAARVAAVEGTAAGVRWTFSPMLDIARDPRWGRIAEGCGEDPYLTSRMGEGHDKGLPNKQPDRHQKHGGMHETLCGLRCIRRRKGLQHH